MKRKEVLASEVLQEPGYRSRVQHDTVLDRLVKPSVFMNDSLTDDIYLIQTDDPNGRRRSVNRIDFAKPVLPGPVLLTDDQHVHDLLTLKLSVIFAFDVQLGWKTAAQGLSQTVCNLLTLVRWRNAQGITRFADLTAAFFERYLDELAESGTRGLVPLEERASEYISNLRAGLEVPPIKNRRLRPNEIAKRLGLSNISQMPAKLWLSILEECREQDAHACRNNRVLLREDDHGGFTVNYLASNIQCWEQLYQLRHVLSHDPLPFEPWNRLSSSLDIARSLTTRSVGRTPLPPPYQTCFLLNAALDFIQNAAPLLLRMESELSALLRNSEANGLDREQVFERYVGDLRQSLGERECPMWLHDLKGYKFKNSKEHSSKSGIYFQDVLYRCLPGAAALVLVGFTARRNIEIMSARTDCLWRDEYERLFISAWSAKNLRRLDSIPAPESITSVVALLTTLSDKARTADGSTWLFNFKDWDNQQVGYHLQDYIDNFVKIASVPVLPDGTEWVPTPHQFRVFFPTMYYHRFDYPSLLALCRFLKHVNIDVTRTYVTAIVTGSRISLADEARAAGRSRDELKARLSARKRADDFEVGRISFLRGIVIGIAEGSITPTGAGGRQWASDLRALVKRSQEFTRFTSSSSDRSFTDLIDDWVKGKALEPHPQGHSFCKCTGSASDLTSAACLLEKQDVEGIAPVANRVPDLAYAADLTCLVCPHRVGLPCNERYWDEAATESDAAATSAALATQRTSAIERSSRIRRHLGPDRP